MLAFDLQMHAGALQITSTGAGTAHYMPEGVEYLHCVQMVVDEEELRLQVFDEIGQRREKLTSPPILSASTVVSADTPWNPGDSITACLLDVRATVDAGHGDLSFPEKDLDVRFAIAPLDSVLASGATSSTAATGGDDGA